MELDLLVIGATAAGWQGAITAARLDRKVGLVAQRSSPEAVTVDLRDVPGELLRDVCSDWPIPKRGKRSQSIGIDSNSWRQFADYTRRIWQQEQAAYQQQLLAAGGKFWTGDPYLVGPQRVALKRPRTKLIELVANHLLIATGTTPGMPTFAVSSVPPAKDAAGLLDATGLSGDACVIGASITGWRAACLLALWGCRVRLVDGRAITAASSNEDTVDWYAWGLELGVRLESGEDVIGLKAKTTTKMDVILESGRHIAAETVWLATGRQGRTGALKLGNVGLTTDDCGRLWCDPDYRTWVPSIHAVGGVVGFPPGMDGHPETAGEIAKNIFRAVSAKSA